MVLQRIWFDVVLFKKCTLMNTNKMIHSTFKLKLSPRSPICFFFLVPKASGSVCHVEILAAVGQSTIILLGVFITKKKKKNKLIKSEFDFKETLQIDMRF